MRLVSVFIDKDVEINLNDTLLININYNDFMVNREKVDDLVNNYIDKGYNIYIKPHMDSSSNSDFAPFVDINGSVCGICDASNQYRKSYINFLQDLYDAYNIKLIVDIAARNNVCYCDKHMKMYQIELDKPMDRPTMKNIMSNVKNPRYYSVRQAIYSVNDFVETNTLLSMESTDIIAGFDISNIAYRHFAKTWNRLLSNINSNEFIMISDNENSLSVLYDTIDCKIKPFLMDNDGNFSSFKYIKANGEDLIVVVNDDYAILNKQPLDFFNKMGYNIIYKSNLSLKNKLIYIDSEVVSALSPYNIVYLINNNKVIIDEKCSDCLRNKDILFVMNKASILKVQDDNRCLIYEESKN